MNTLLFALISLLSIKPLLVLNSTPTQLNESSNTDLVDDSNLLILLFLLVLMVKRSLSTILMMMLRQKILSIIYITNHIIQLVNILDVYLMII